MRWLCTTSGECVSLDNSCVILWWLCTTGGDCVSLDNSCVPIVVVVYHWTIVVYYYSVGCVQLAVIVYHYVMATIVYYWITL
jgi:hypothetical protein